MPASWKLESWNAGYSMKHNKEYLIQNQSSVVFVNCNLGSLTMSSCGRKQDSIWQYFDKSVKPGKTGCRATCRSYPKEMQGIPARMKLHLTQCINVDNKQPPVLRPLCNDSTMPPNGIVAKIIKTFMLSCFSATVRHDEGDQITVYN